MLIGYARVSTTDQKLDLQLDALQQAGCEQICRDVMSSTRLDRPGVDAACSHLRAGDTFVVYKLDRLGRSVKGLIAFTETLKARGVAFISLQDRIDTSTALGQFFFHVIGAFAELERSVIVERTQAGLAAAHAHGRLGGRPRKVTKAKLRIAMAARAGRQSNASEVARLIGINRTVLYRYVNGDGSLKPLGQALLHGAAGRPAVMLDEAADEDKLLVPDPYAHLVTRGRHVSLCILKGFNDTTDLLVHHDRGIDIGPRRGIGTGERGISTA